MSYQEQGGGNESVVVNGAVEGVEIKPNGRFVVKVREIGSQSQYALNLNTKEQSLAQQMMSAIGQQFSFICGLSHWTNQNGQPVTSKWINGVAPLQGGMQGQPQQQPQQQWGGAAPAQQGWQQQTPQPPIPPPTPPPPPSPPTDDAFIRRVSFLAALEPAVAMLQYLPTEQHGVPALIKMADFFAQTAIRRGMFGFEQAPPSQNPGGGSEYHPGYAAQTGAVPAGDDYGTPPWTDGAPPPGDDDVPF